MDDFEQYEVWALLSETGKRWEFIAAFQDFDVASAVASRRGRRVRLIHAIYREGKLHEKNVIAELGSTRSRDEVA